jgi:hypothetical protein
LVSTWNGEERRSSDSVLARAAVTAKEEAETLQGALAGLPGRRFVRRAQLRRALEDARRREGEALEMLRANRRRDTSLPETLEPAAGRGQ